MYLILALDYHFKIIIIIINKTINNLLLIIK